MGDAATFAIVTPVSLSTEKGVYKGMSVEAWEPIRSEHISRRASLAPPRNGGATMNRGRSLQVSVGPTVVDLPPLGSTPAHAATFPRDDESTRARRHRRRYSEHPQSRRRDGSENRPAAAASVTSLHSGPTPQRPKRHPTLNLHDVEDALSPCAEQNRTRRWADTPGASSVAAWVREQQVQAQYQFAPLSPLPITKAQTGFLSKVKKLMGKNKSSE